MRDVSCEQACRRVWPPDRGCLGAVARPGDARGAARAALSSEQKALVDFLVLARGARFVGFGPSTFSFFLREFRALAGTPRGASLLVNGTRIGTDDIFAGAGVVA